MKTNLSRFHRPALWVAAFNLLACTQVHANTPTDTHLSSGLGTLLRYLLPFWF